MDSYTIHDKLVIPGIERATTTGPGIAVARHRFILLHRMSSVKQTSPEAVRYSPEDEAVLPGRIATMALLRRCDRFLLVEAESFKLSLAS